MNREIKGSREDISVEIVKEKAQILVRSVGIAFNL